MKISPVKNYSKPAYAIKIAAIITAAASLSGCAEKNVKLAGESPTPAETTGELLAAAGTAATSGNVTTPEKTEVAGTVTTTEEVVTSEEELECIELAGDVPMPEETAAETAAAVSTAAATTAAVTAAAATTPASSASAEDEIEEDPVLDGGVDVPEDTADIGGAVYVPEDGDIELEGDVYVPDDEDYTVALPEDYLFAKYKAYVLEQAFAQALPEGWSIEEGYEPYDGTMDASLETSPYNWWTFSARWTLLDEYGEESMLIAFTEKGSPAAEALAGCSYAEKVNGGYLIKLIMENNSYFIDVNLLVVEADDFDDELSEEFCTALVNDIAAKGMIE